MRLHLRCEREVPWRHAQRVLVAAADPRIGVHRLRLADAAGFVDVDLPVGGGATTAGAGYPRFEVELARPLDERTGVTLVDWRERREVPGGGLVSLSTGTWILVDGTNPSRAKTLTEIQRRAQSSGRDESVFAVEVSVPAAGGYVPFGDVLDVVRVLKEANAQDIRFRAPPRQAASPVPR